MRLRAYLELFRIFETQLIAGSTILTLLILGSNDIILMIKLSAGMFCGTAGIMAWNDSLDITEDTIAHPERPIISGRIGILEARLLGTILLIVALIIAFLLSTDMLLLGIAGLVIGIGYSLTSKAQFILIAPLKNIVVSGTTALFLILIPQLLLIAINTQYIIYVLSMTLVLFSYEILKDIRDVEGDSAAGYQTLPLRVGITTSARVSVFIFVLSCLLMGGVFLSLNQTFEAVISFITSGLVIIPFYWLFKTPQPETSDRTRIAVVTILLLSLGSISVSLYLKN